MTPGNNLFRGNSRVTARGKEYGPARCKRCHVNKFVSFHTRHAQLNSSQFRYHFHTFSISQMFIHPSLPSSLIPFPLSLSLFLLPFLPPFLSLSLSLSPHSPSVPPFIQMNSSQVRSVTLHSFTFIYVYIKIYIYKFIYLKENIKNHSLTSHASQTQLIKIQCQLCIIRS